MGFCLSDIASFGVLTHSNCSYATILFPKCFKKKKEKKNSSHISFYSIHTRLIFLRSCENYDAKWRFRRTLGRQSRPISTLCRETNNSPSSWHKAMCTLPLFRFQKVCLTLTGSSERKVGPREASQYKRESRISTWGHSETFKSRASDKKAGPGEQRLRSVLMWPYLLFYYLWKLLLVHTISLNKQGKLRRFLPCEYIRTVFSLTAQFKRCCCCSEALIQGKYHKDFWTYYFEKMFILKTSVLQQSACGHHMCAKS